MEINHHPAKSFPLISCVCVTRGKPLLLRSAISYFLDQTYPNKELIIIYEDDDKPTGDVIRRLLPHPSIKAFVVPRKWNVKLGRLRNLGNERAAGEYICQWDDDDWFHSGRLDYQYKTVLESGLGGCVMRRWLLFDAPAGNAYISHVRSWEGSLLCRSDLLRPKRYLNRRSGEETVVIDSLIAERVIHYIDEAPFLYIYIYHGHNTWGYSHWKDLFKKGIPLPNEVNALIARLCIFGNDGKTGSDRLTEVFQKLSLPSNG
jgi:glycosyltransferase involved in cell wall biosynthesis